MTVETNGNEPPQKKNSGKATAKAPAGATVTPPKANPPDESKVRRIPGVQLNVKPGKEVVLRIPGRNQSYRGKVVGLDPYDYVIVKVRLPSAIRHELKYGGKVVVKYVQQGSIYGFRALVHNAISSPAPLLFFEYPDMIEKLDLRRTERTRCNIDGMLHTTDDEVECMIVNVSESGCKISARATSRDMLKNTQVDDALIVAMNLGNFGELKVAVAVKNITMEKGIISLGCMFLDITKDEMRTINDYLEKLNRLTG